MKREKSIGIDPSSTKLDVFFTVTCEVRSFENSGKGIKKLLRYLEQIQPDLVTIESTGKYHRKAARAVSEAGLSILVAQPKRVRDFARGLGVLAKTDPLDARCIALYGQKCDLAATVLPSLEEEKLKDLVARRHQVVELISIERNRLSSAPKELRESSRRVIKQLEKEKGLVNGLVTAQLKLCKGATKQLKLLTSTKGVGEVVAAILIAYLPELGTLSKRQVASLCGVAPFNRDSGKGSKTRSIFGGRAIVRSALYMAALSASRFDPELAQKYQNLLQRGKNKRVALIAIMRKLIIRLNAMIRTNTMCRYAAAQA